MNTCRKMLKVAMAAAFFAACFVRADAQSWIGRDIIMKQNGSRIGQSDENGNQVYHAKLTNISYRVLDDRDGWLKVQAGKQKGWFNKNEAVLVDDADAYFTALLRNDPSNDQYYARRGWAFYLLRDYKGAANDYTQAIRLRPNEIDWHSSRGMILRDNRDYDGSIRDFNRALQIDPGRAYLYHQRGWSYYFKKDYAKAIADCSECIRLDPNNCYGLNRRGRVLMATGELDRALADFAEALRDHECTWALNNRGETWAMKSQFDKAIAEYERSMKSDAAAAYAPNALAWLLATCGDSRYRDGARAVDLARKACQLDGKNMSHFGTLAAALAQVGEFDEAIRMQEKALENAAYALEHGDAARERLNLYRQKKAYVSVADDSKPSSQPMPTTAAPVASSPPAPVAPTFVSEGPLKGWQEFRAPDGSFAVTFPERPKGHKQRVSSGVGNIENQAYSHEDVNLTYLVSYFDLPGDGVLTLDTAAEKYATARKGKLTSQKDLTLGKNRGREIQVQLADKSVSRLRLFEVGQRRFQIAVDGNADLVNSAQSTSFLDSFTVTR